MAYTTDLGTGALGDVTISTPVQLNSYANVTAQGGSKNITIGTPSVGAYGSFTVGQDIAFHSTGCLTSEISGMGLYGFARITGVAGSVLTLNKDIPVVDLSKYLCQVVQIPNFNNLTINCSLSPLPFDSTNKYGGIVIVKAKSKIDLTNGMTIAESIGLPYGTTLKPNGIVSSLDDLKNKLVFSVGNGIVICITASLIFSSISRVGASWTGTYNSPGIGGNAGSNGAIAGSNAIGSTGGNGGASGNAFGGGGTGGLGGARGYYGGYGATSDGAVTTVGAMAGAVVLLVAKTIIGWDLNVLQTGGFGGNRTYDGSAGSNGGAGFGGGGSGGARSGAYDGGGAGGGGAGSCLIATDTNLPLNPVAYILAPFTLVKPNPLNPQLYYQTQMESSYPIGQ